jgi:hypothetical protein
MATLLDDDNFSITEDTIREKVVNAVDTYSTYFEKAPTFVNYYSIDYMTSRRDVSLGTFDKVVGADSPLKFSKIEDLPIYSIEEFDLSLEETTFGSEGAIESTAVIPPDMVVPRIDDVFTINHDGLDALYRVSNVKKSHISGPAFYSITFFLYETSILDIEDQVSEELKVVNDGTRPENTRIVKKSNAVLLEILNACIDNLQDLYISEFLIKHPIEEIAVVDFDGFSSHILSDVCLKKFCIDNNLFKRSKPYRNEISLDLRNSRYIKDKLSIFELIQKDMTSLSEVKSFITFEQVVTSGYNFLNIIPITVFTGILKEVDSVVTTDLFGFLKGDGAGLEYIEDTVFKTINATDNSNIVIALKEFELDESNIIANYYLLPILLFVLRTKYRELILN